MFEGNSIPDLDSVVYNKILLLTRVYYHGVSLIKIQKVMLVLGPYRKNEDLYREGNSMF